MTTRLYNTLFTLVQPHVDGCPPPTIVNAIREAAIELCTKGFAWRADLTPMNITALTSTYALAPPTDTRVVTVMVARYNGVVMRMRRTQDVRVLYPLHPDTTTPATPSEYNQPDPRTIDLYAVPAVSLASALALNVALRPTVGSTGMDATVMDDYEEELVNGTLHRLLKIPKRPWTDAKLSDFYGRKFRADVFAVKARTEIGYTQGSIAVEIPRIA